MFVAGGPASGKSTIVRQGSVELPGDPVLIDVDSVKEQLPEYQQMVDAGDPNAAAFVHEESSALGSRIRREAQKQRSDIVLDGVGNSDYAKLKRKVDDAKSQGYAVEAHYVTVPTEVALQRNRERYEKTGRLVPDYVIENSHRKVSIAVINALNAGLFDDFELWDTDTPDGVPVKVATAQGRRVQILNESRWASFAAKAGPDGPKLGDPAPDAGPDTPRSSIVRESPRGRTSAMDGSPMEFELRRADGTVARLTSTNILPLLKQLDGSPNSAGLTIVNLTDRGKPVAVFNSAGTWTPGTL